MDTETAGEVTRLLVRWKEGDSQAAEDLFPLVYGELRSVASAYLSRERQNHTLQPTALVHEAYLRLSKVADLDARDRSHFFAIAARTMRRILVDHARLQAADKRVGAQQKLSLEEALVSDPVADPQMVLRVHEALEDLESEHPRVARLVELRFFVGLSEAEAADLLGLSRTTTTRDWRFAKLWLFDHLST